jgi:hypothetical protein
MIFISPKVIEQLSLKSKLKVSPFTNLPHGKWGYFWSTFKICLVLIFLEVNSYNNDRGEIIYNSISTHSYAACLVLYA